jgi:rRNA-processing protein FCF1
LRSNRSIQRILLDTSFLMPTVGIDVDERVTDALSKLRPEEREVYYSKLSLLECTWMAARQLREGKYDDTIFRKGLLSIIKTRVYSEARADVGDYLYALELFRLGNKDMIDNLLYSTSISNQCKFLTVDEPLRRFIEKKGIENVVISPGDL